MALVETAETSGQRLARSAGVEVGCCGEPEEAPAFDGLDVNTPG